jgi:2-polyprenyl-3-methyl-5-hydroxy-6-metoxy-1,4-benzoquinol methylase
MKQDETSSTDEDSYRSRLYVDYATTHAGREDRQRVVTTLLHDIAPLLPPRLDARILDVGCGQGDLVAMLSRLGYKGAGGIDVSPEQVRLAHEAGVQNIQQGDLLPFLERSVNAFDAIVATDVLEHFAPPDALALFDLIANSLRPGGRLIARVPNGASPFAGRYRYGDLTHGLSYTSRSVHQAAAMAGFVTVEVRACPPVVHGVISAVRLLVWWLLSALLKGALAVETGELRGHIVTQNLIFVATKGV